MHAYEIDSALHCDLGQALRQRLLRDEGDNETSAAFVLWAAEQIRAHLAERLTWTFLFSAIGLPTDENLGRTLSENGLVWWRRQWRESAHGKPDLLAEMFLLRELFRRPKVQNNAETMGLVRLVFPGLEARAASCIPKPLHDAGYGADTWTALAHAAVDLEFRENFAVQMRTSPDLVHWVSPRRYGLRSVFQETADRSEIAEKNPHFWPGPASSRRLVRLVYALIQGDQLSSVDRARAGEVLDALWRLVTSTAARDSGKGAFRIDMTQAAVARLDEWWVCPLTRKVLWAAIGGRSPYDPGGTRAPVRVIFPRLPIANSGGLNEANSNIIAQWLEKDPTIAALRSDGLWSDLHDRVAQYTPFFRAQEHSAQIDRPLLQIYEEEFRAGGINILSCSTTMEMGVDIPNVGVVVNTNLPPAVSNYRQRVGRAGRRGEPWAMAFTFCRDLPLDRAVFQDPHRRLLTAPIAAPMAQLESRTIVQRHVNAALLGMFLRHRGGADVMATIGGFFVETADASASANTGSLGDQFLFELKGIWGQKPEVMESLSKLVHGTVLEGDNGLVAAAAEAFHGLMVDWRRERQALLEQQAVAHEPEVQKLYGYRLRRMEGEFLLGELARRRFTPSYGFPVDVVSFDHMRPKKDHPSQKGVDATFGERLGGPSRQLDAAIRDYAPGSEVVVDGLVHLSEGVRPAWVRTADASGVEDLRTLWDCPACHCFGLSRDPNVDECPHCGGSSLQLRKVLRPAGFMGRQRPHTGYESLSFVASELPRVVASGNWHRLSASSSSRFRASSEGHVVTLHDY